MNHPNVEIITETTQRLQEDVQANEVCVVNTELYATAHVIAYRDFQSTIMPANLWILRSAARPMSKSLTPYTIPEQVTQMTTPNSAETAVNELEQCFMM